MLFGRDKEIERLDSLYREDKFNTVFVYSHRNMGKSSLVREFVKEKDSIFFTVLDAPSSTNLAEFSKRVYAFFNVPEQAGSFQSWTCAFEFINKYSKKYKFVIAIDNFTNLLKYDLKLDSILAEFIENYFISNRFVLVLSGDKRDFSNKIIRLKNPLWGKQNLILNLDNISYENSLKFLGEMGFEDKKILISCLGNNPGYLSAVDHKLNAIGNLKQLFFTKSGYLFLQVQIEMKESIRELGVYNSILYAIANGNKRLSDITKETGQDRTKINKYITYLIENDIIKKEFPFGDNPLKSRKGRYSIVSNTFEFWYKFVFPNLHEVYNDYGELLIGSDEFNFALNNYVEDKYLKTICENYITQENQKENLPIKAIGLSRYWENKREVFIAYNKSNEILISGIIFGENSQDYKKINDLISLKNKFYDYKKIYFYVFSDRPFSKEAYELEEKQSNLTLLYI